MSFSFCFVLCYLVLLDFCLVTVLGLSPLENYVVPTIQYLPFFVLCCGTQLLGSCPSVPQYFRFNYCSGCFFS